MSKEPKTKAKTPLTPETRRIGLSLGADICWPIAYREIMKQLQLRIPYRRQEITFEIENVTIEPFGLQQPCRYDLVIDRLTHWYNPTREWIKKGVILDDLYVFNNPWSIQSMEKHTSYVAMMRLGLPVPPTWMLPAKAYPPSEDLEITLKRYARLFDLGEIGERVGYPFYMKPYDGGGWKGVSRIENLEQLKRAYNESGMRLMHLQKAVEPHDLFVRCVGLGPQVRIVRYDPGAPLHDRYTMDSNFTSADDDSVLRDMTLTINSFFGWDFNSCEALRSDGIWHPIDYANPCPDSQVTSLHYHFPWLIMANIRWSVFCSVTNRPMRMNMDWLRFFRAVDPEMSLQERLHACAAVAHKHFSTDQFTEFCNKHLAHLEDVTHEFFGTDTARDAVHQKVSALFPTHEIERFTELFWNRIQHWRNEASAARQEA